MPHVFARSVRRILFSTKADDDEPSTLLTIGGPHLPAPTTRIGQPLSPASRKEPRNAVTPPARPWMATALALRQPGSTSRR
jgi:hypothetical protein